MRAGTDCPKARGVTIDDLPRFVFIVGAPRCGTTTLAGFLKGHPRVCFPLVKEPHFFLQPDTCGLDAEALRRLVEREYLDRFYAQCDSSRDTGVDGSVSYLYAPDELLPALSLWPDAKFVIALRDPMTMLPSLHQRLKYTGDETIERFDEAWAAIPDRVAGRRIEVMVQDDGGIADATKRIAQSMVTREGVEVLAQVPASETPQPGPAPDGAGADLEPVARIVAVRSGNLLATSFHPEVTGERRVHELFIRMIRGEA